MNTAPEGSLDQSRQGIHGYLVKRDSAKRLLRDRFQFAEQFLQVAVRHFETRHAAATAALLSLVSSMRIITLK
jgi:hypothetical protein